MPKSYKVVLLVNRELINKLPKSAPYQKARSAKLERELENNPKSKAKGLLLINLKAALAASTCFSSLREQRLYYSILAPFYFNNFFCFYSLAKQAAISAIAILAHSISASKQSLVSTRFFHYPIKGIDLETPLILQDFPAQI